MATKKTSTKTTTKKTSTKKAVKKTDYFGLGSIVSLILAIIPVSAWILGIVVRFKEKKYLAGVIRIIGGWLIWILDLIFMIKDKKIFRLLNM